MFFQDQITAITLTDQPALPIQLSANLPDRILLLLRLLLQAEVRVAVAVADLAGPAETNYEEIFFTGQPAHIQPVEGPVTRRCHTCVLDNSQWDRPSTGNRWGDGITWRRNLCCLCQPRGSWFI